MIEKWVDKRKNKFFLQEKKEIGKQHTAKISSVSKLVVKI